MLKLRIQVCILMVAVLPVCVSCSGDQPESKPVVRDTTITHSNAFIDLFLDSVTVHHFLDTVDISPDDSLSIAGFYKNRNYQYAWFDTAGLTEHATSFVSLYRDYRSAQNDSSLINNSLDKTVDQLIDDSSYLAEHDNILNPTELALTLQFFKYAGSAYSGDPTIDLKTLGWFIPRKKIDITSFLDSVITGHTDDFSQYEPVHPMFSPLRKYLAKYSEISKNGGWPVVTPGEDPYREGDSLPAIRLIKKRLQLVGDLSDADTGNVFTAETKKAVTNFQHRYGLAEDGVVGRGTLAEMNVPATERVKQLAVNIERIKWMPMLGKGRYIVANIPAFMLYVFDSGKLQFAMRIVVGKAATSSAIFSDELETIAFSPYWNVPYSIVKNEMAGRSASYISRQNMEVVGHYSDGLPRIRQRPGGKNALGKVKFLFPNSYSIYFHDTPSKSLFELNKRAFSHGCIRIQEPEKMANWLLEGNDKYPPEKVKELMNQDHETMVKLDKKVPVFIGYFTAWIDRDNQLNLRDDIYHHDEKMKAMMFGDK